jgi:hypothetical protein
VKSSLLYRRQAQRTGESQRSVIPDDLRKALAARDVAGFPQGGNSKDRKGRDQKKREALGRKPAGHAGQGAQHGECRKHRAGGGKQVGQEALGDLACRLPRHFFFSVPQLTRFSVVSISIRLASMRPGQHSGIPFVNGERVQSEMTHTEIAMAAIAQARSSDSAAACRERYPAYSLDILKAVIGLFNVYNERNGIGESTIYAEQTRFERNDHDAIGTTCP